MAAHHPCCRPAENGIHLLVRLTPKAARDAIDGIIETADGRSHLKARVRAVPEGGKANAALERLLARAFAIPPSAVSVTGGAAARLKTVTLIGDQAALAGKLAALASGR